MARLNSGGSCRHCTYKGFDGSTLRNDCVIEGVLAAKLYVAQQDRRAVELPTCTGNGLSIEPEQSIVQYFTRESLEPLIEEAPYAHCSILGSACLSNSAFFSRWC